MNLSEFACALCAAPFDNDRHQPYLTWCCAEKLVVCRACTRKPCRCGYGKRKGYDRRLVKPLLSVQEELLSSSGTVFSLQCPVCMSYFSQTVKPMLLSACDHVHCSRCLSKLEDKCSVCRATTKNATPMPCLSAIATALLASGRIEEDPSVGDAELDAAFDAAMVEAEQHGVYTPTTQYFPSGRVRPTTFVILFRMFLLLFILITVCSVDTFVFVFINMGSSGEYLVDRGDLDVLDSLHDGFIQINNVLIIVLNVLIDVINIITYHPAHAVRYVCNFIMWLILFAFYYSPGPLRTFLNTATNLNGDFLACVLDIVAADGDRTIPCTSDTTCYFSNYLFSCFANDEAWLSNTSCGTSCALSIFEPLPTCRKILRHCAAFYQ